MQDSFGLVGSIIASKYRVEAVVGEGGFGVVYRGHHLGFDQPIAIKCLKVPAHFTGDARRLFIERFAEEGKLLFRLSEHRAIVRVFDHAVLEVHGQDVPYLVLEWLDGVSLHDHLQQRREHGLAPMSEHGALRLLRDPIEGLAFAHQLRVAHRDIKPENLFLVRTSTGTITKLLDFGVAKLMEEADIATQYATATSSGFRAFSPQYGAPEQFYSKTYGQTGPWTDVHAMGLLFTELVSTRPAFDGCEFGELYTQSTGAVRPTPRARGAQVPAGFEELCAKALALEPRQRYRSGTELLGAVDAYLQETEDKARTKPDLRTRQRRRAGRVAAGFAVAVLSFVVWSIVQRVSGSAATGAAPVPPSAAPPAPRRRVATSRSSLRCECSVRRRAASFESSSGEGRGRASRWPGGATIS